jgi:potassium-transporting ATPase KdpC subunit
MNKSILISVRILFFLTLLTGIVYPLGITGISLLFFHSKAEGSLVELNGKVVGSELIGQQTDGLAYFHSRPSAVNYQTQPSGASNLSWTDKRLKEMVASRKAAFQSENMLPETTVIPKEMLFASASGIDPYISPLAAILQVERIASARNFNDGQKQKLILLVAKMTEKPQYSLFGEERINVFLLNLELDLIE